MDINKIEDIKRLSLQTLKEKIEGGDIDSIRLYLTNIDFFLDNSLEETCLDKLEKKIENGDIKAISVFYQYISQI